MMIVQNHLIRVGIGDIGVVHSPDTIRTSGLGSCVGIIVFDEVKKTAGMAHIMLPDSKMAKKEGLNRAKYADTAVDDLLLSLKRAGVYSSRLKAKVAGGAQMFKFRTTSEMMRIGPRNVEAVKKELLAYKIPIVAEDVGGSCGRTIEFDPRTSELRIRKVSQGVSVI